MGKQTEQLSPFCVLRLVLDTGERLPCLVDRETWLPVRLATRWAMRYRRYRRQSSTLADNLRILGSLYTWARTRGGFDLDDYLTQGNILTPRQIEAFVSTLRLPDTFNTLGQTAGSSAVSPLIDAGTYDHYLSITEMFLTWALDSMNRGGVSRLSLEQLTVERVQLSYLFQSLRIGARPAQRMEPLEDLEIQHIRETIGPKHDGQNPWTFPDRIFSEATRLRNWLMFEVALQLGVRRGELLKLRLDCRICGLLRNVDSVLSESAESSGANDSSHLLCYAQAVLQAVHQVRGYRRCQTHLSPLRLIADQIEQQRAVYAQTPQQ